MVDGEKGGKARLVAKSHQGPDLRGGSVGTSGRVSLRSLHLQVIPPGALEKWSIWILDVKNTFLRADGFGREVFLGAPAAWGPEGTHRIWKLRAPAYGLRGAPVAPRRALRRYLLNSVSSSRPRFSFVFRKNGGAVGVLTTHIDDILGPGEPDVLSKVLALFGRHFGALKV